MPTVGGAGPGSGASELLVTGIRQLTPKKSCQQYSILDSDGGAVQGLICWFLGHQMAGTHSPDSVTSPFGPPVSAVA